MFASRCFLVNNQMHSASAISKCKREFTFPPNQKYYLRNAETSMRVIKTDYFSSFRKPMNQRNVSRYLNKSSIFTREFLQKETFASFDQEHFRFFCFQNPNAVNVLHGHTLRKHCNHCQSTHLPHKRNYSTQSQDSLQGELDRYQGIWIDLRQLSSSISDCQFDILLKASLLTWRENGLKTVWLQVAIAQGGLVAVAAHHGFRFHHAEGQQATLLLDLDSSRESRVPLFASHQVGVSGVVIKEETKEVLVVQDKGRRYTLWKFPGGLSDLGEDIAKTAEREVFEETGLQTEFQSILAFRQQHDHPGAFGRSDIYILCRLKPLTFDLNPCVEEISACQWMKVEELKREVHASSITHRMAEIISFGLREGWDKVDICPTKMESIYKGKMFHMFNRPLH
ncbi:nucleoside diphosphate-linked moiety X motif 6-like [Elysia marginata]|uniref:Nucleoside diphosphate-linked moiety X motif 6 n=1 Tax=Elysia marginata TaxID=1093978 RepID=A0AAV4EW24_9GAST|nr:nucleoside diphosphate-linked moiety X motif 6-like [Elysia marginata]